MAKKENLERQNLELFRMWVKGGCEGVDKYTGAIEDYGERMNVREGANEVGSMSAKRRGLYMQFSAHPARCCQLRRVFRHFGFDILYLR